MPTRPVVRIALTGGIATGKSYCLKEFARLGAATIDGDTLAKQSIGRGTPGETAAIARFGRDIVGADGAIDRKVLARIIFRDADARRDLEAIVHPFIYASIESWLAELERSTPAGQRRIAIADIPLLFETSRAGDFDAVIVAACSPEQQIARMIVRDGLSETEARQRLAAQLPIAAKRARADYVIDTSGTMAGTNARVAEVWEELRHS